MEGVGVRFHPDGAAAVVDAPHDAPAGLTIGRETVSLRSVEL